MISSKYQDELQRVYRQIRAHMKALGYRFEYTDTETEWIERVIRPDGTLAIVARKQKDGGPRPTGPLDN